MAWIMEMGRMFRVGIDSTRDTRVLGKNNAIVLDPITTLFRLSSLKYMPDLTKLAFDTHKLHLHQGDSVWKAPLRQLRGDSRDDIHYLNNPLSLVSEWLDEHECGVIKNELFEYALEGLKVLEDTYKMNGQTATHAIRHYKNYLNTRQLSSSSSSPRSRSGSGSGETSSNGICSGSEGESSRINPIYANIKNKIWKTDEILLVGDLLRIINKNQIERESFLNALSVILDAKEELTGNIIDKIVSGESSDC